jgi:hypothetical protein
MHKKGIELSVNFIVMMILTIVVFSFGIKFAYDVYHRSVTISENMDKQTQEKIKGMLFEGQIVAIPENTKSIKILGTDYFGLGILNQLGEKRNFKFFIKWDTAVDPNGNKFEPEITNIEASDWTTKDESRVYEIKDNGFELVTIDFTPPAGTKKGTYVFNVNVCYDVSSGATNDKCPQSYPYLYDYTHQIRIEVI